MANWHSLWVSIGLSLVILMSPSSVTAMTPPWGVGVIVGHPTGLSVKTRMNDLEGIDFGAAWSFDDDHKVHLHGDYLFHRYNIFRGAEAGRQVPVYYGVGFRILHEEDDDDLMGIRIPIGIAFEPSNVTLDVFVELVPMIDVFPETGLSLFAAAGARFYF